MRTYFSLFALIGIVSGAGCKKQDSTPQYTGSNTLSCQIDGADFTPHLDPILVTPRKALDAKKTLQPGGFYLEAKNTFNTVQWNVVGVKRPGTYTLGYARFPMPYAPNLSSYGAYFRSRPITPADDPFNPPRPIAFYTDAVNTGTITFARYDTVARVAGGTFEFTARDAASGNLVRITNGKFDVQF